MALFDVPLVKLQGNKGSWTSNLPLPEMFYSEKEGKLSEPLPNVPLDDVDDQRVEEVKVNSCPKVLRHNVIKLHTNGKKL